MLAGPFAYYLLPIFVPWVPIFGLIEYIFIVFIYPVIVSISLVPKLVASEGEFAVRFRAGWVIVVVSGGGWVLMVKVEEGQVMVMVMVVECRGRMVPIRVIGSAGTATVVILVTIRRVGEVSGAFVNFLVVTIDGFPVVEYQVLLVVVEVRGGWVVVVIVVEMIRAMGTATVIIGVRVWLLLEPEPAKRFGFRYSAEPDS